MYPKYTIYIQENRTGLGHYRSEDSILDQMENHISNKYKDDVESIDTLDPDEFFGCADGDVDHNTN